MFQESIPLSLFSSSKSLIGKPVFQHSFLYNQQVDLNPVYKLAFLLGAAKNVC